MSKRFFFLLPYFLLFLCISFFIIIVLITVCYHLFSFIQVFFSTSGVCFLFRTWFFLLVLAQGSSWFDFLSHFRSSLSAFLPPLSDHPFAPSIRLFFWLNLFFYRHIRNLDSALILEVHSNVNFVPFVCKDPKCRRCLMHLKLYLTFLKFDPSFTFVSRGKAPW